MKRVSVTILFLSAIILACNNAAEDSVERADSINQANIDSPSVNQSVVADEETATFLVKAADGGMTEMQLGELAVIKAGNARVKEFGDMMVQGHSAVNAQVKDLATSRNVVLPDSVSDESRRHVEDLSKKSGAGFDKSYMREVIRSHESIIDLFEKSMERVKDAEVKTFINNTLPKVKEHLESARALQKELK